MQVGDLVRNRHSEKGELGIVLSNNPSDFDAGYLSCAEKFGLTAPDRCLVAWLGGRVAPILRCFVEVVNESR